MKKFLVIGGFSLTLLVAGIFAVVGAFDLDSINVPKETIVSAIQKKLPLTKELPFGNKIKVVSADLELAEGTVGVILNIDAHTRMPVHCKTSPSSRSSGGFGFTRLRNKFNALKGKGVCYDTNISHISVFAEGSIVYAGSKFYFQPKSQDSIQIRTKMEEPFLKKHEAKVGMILGKVAYAYLDRFHVYDLKKQGIIISASLESVEVHPDYITVNLSLMALTKTLMIYLAAFVLAIGYAFAAFRNPSLLFFLAW